MNRTEKITGAFMALLAMAAAGQFYMDKTGTTETVAEAKTEPGQPQQSVPEAKVPTLDETVASALMGIDEKDEGERLVAIGALVEALEADHGLLSDESGEALAKVALKGLEGIDGAPIDTSGVTARFAYQVASRTRGESGKAFVLKVLGDGPEELKGEVLRGVGRPGGVRGKEIAAKVEEVLRSGGKTSREAAKAMRRAGGRKAGFALLEVMRSTGDALIVSGCAVAIQDTQDPSLFGPMLERLEAVGLLDDPKRMPWISGKLLSEHLKTAEGAGKERGYKVAKIRPKLIPEGIADQADAGTDAVLKAQLPETPVQ